MAELKEIQAIVHRVRSERGFTMDPVKIFALLAEEVGEVAGELKRTWSKNYKEFSKSDLEAELADVLICVLALANQFGIDLEQALMEKMVDKDGKRLWKTARNI